MEVKDFDQWNREKKQIDEKDRLVFGYPREVWWCSIGLNIGVEIDGKNENFERPVVIMRVYNKETMLVLPTTGKEIKNKFHFSIEVDAKRPGTGELYKRTVHVKLTQARVISNKRLLRKVDIIPESVFKKLQSAFKLFT